jgi:hypothetical protein
MIDAVRTTNPARDARDCYVAEHVEIASSEILEWVAERAGDWGTAVVARENRADERAMAERLGGRWDKVVKLRQGGHARVARPLPWSALARPSAFRHPAFAGSAPLACGRRCG